MFDPTELQAAYAPPDPGGSAWLRMNFVSSIDGAVSVGGKSGGLNDEWDLQVFQMLRSQSDLVLVGAGTLRKEAYDGVRVPDALAAWREEHGYDRQPRLGIVTRAGNLDPAGPLFTNGRVPEADWLRPLVFCPDDSDVSALEPVAEIVRCSGDDSSQVEPRRIVTESARRGYAQILCEGGPQLFGSLLEADVVDEICLTISPLAIAGGAGRIAASETEVPRDFELTHALPGGKMLFLRYTRRR